MRITGLIGNKGPRSQRSRKVDPRADDLLLDMALARIAAPVAGMRMARAGRETAVASPITTRKGKERQ